MSITPFFHVYHKYVFIMSNINKIRLSGTTYSIQDLNATKTVELTQAQYDALSVKDPNTFYIITDATAGDLSNYYTKTETDGLLDTKLDITAYTPTDLSNYYTKTETSGATEISTALESKADTATTYTKTETDNAITAATSTKQDTLVSGTNIKTINGETLLGEGNITIEGGGSSYTAGDGIDITNDVISVSGVSHNSLVDGTEMLLKGDVTSIGQNYTNIVFNYYYGTSNNKTEIKLKPLKINGESALKTASSSISVIETSAITTSVTSSSTDSQVPSAKAVYDQFGGLKLVKLTQSEYDSLTTKDNSTLYLIVN